MRIYRCWFCSSPIYPGHGTLFVRNDCKEFRFCRGKCHKAFKKHKNPRKVKWTKVSRRARKKELTDDLAQTFEKKRNALFRYERDTVLKTLDALPKIDQIRQRREATFIQKRLMKGVQQRRQEDIKLVKTQMHLIKAPRVQSKFLEPDPEDTSDDYEEEEEEQLEKEQVEEFDVDEEMAVDEDKDQEQVLNEAMDVSLLTLEAELDKSDVKSTKKAATKTKTTKKRQKLLVKAR